MYYNIKLRRKAMPSNYIDVEIIEETRAQVEVLCNSVTCP